MLKNLQLSSLSFPFREIRFESFAIYQTVKHKGASARLTSAINYLLWSQRQNPQLQPAVQLQLYFTFFQSHLFTGMCSVSSHCEEKEGKKA